MLPPSDRLLAHCFQLAGQGYLALGPGAESLAGLGQGAFSPACIRYAFPRFETRRPFFPTLAADDWGTRYQGLPAIDWLSSQGLSFPRADVLGLWSDGTEDQLVVKELDLAVPMLAYAAAGDGLPDFPGMLLSAAVELVEKATFALAPGANFPARLLSAIPAFQLNAALPPAQAAQLLPLAAANPRLIPLADLDA